MSGLDKMIARLESDCEARCEQIALEAAADAAGMLEAASRESRAEAERVFSDADKQAELIVKKAESTAAANARRLMLEAKVALIEETVDAAVKKLRSLDAPSYFGILQRLVEKYRTGEPGVLYFGASDAARMPEDFLQAFPEISVSDGSAPIEDGFILKYGDIEINCTFDALRSASLDDLKTVAAEQLFL
ncbi:MAG: V-type ATP synthase subunit E [Clostridia bacterium]|nr:V-type ATP synthase subunit E [Clostridia bacterium]